MILIVLLDQTEKSLVSKKNLFPNQRTLLRNSHVGVRFKPRCGASIKNIPLKKSAAKISRHRQEKGYEYIKNRLRLASSPDNKVLK